MSRFPPMGRVLCGVLLFLPAPSASELSLEYQVKAAFLLNFARYADWPGNGEGPLTVCIAGEAPLQQEIAARLKGEAVKRRPVLARVVSREEEVTQCDLLFVPRDGERHAAALLNAVRSHPVLTVGETHEFLAQGGSIVFFLQDGKVRFRIDPVAVERSGVRVSSRLLALSRDLPEVPR